MCHESKEAINLSNYEKMSGCIFQNYLHTVAAYFDRPLITRQNQLWQWDRSRPVSSECQENPTCNLAVATVIGN